MAVGGLHSYITSVVGKRPEPRRSWLPTAAARVRSQMKSCGICGGQSEAGAGFLRVLRFPLRILIPPIVPHSSTIRGWYNRPISGRRTKWTQVSPHPQETTKKKGSCLRSSLFSHDPKVQLRVHKSLPLAQTS
jgi:hypothetical protein